MFACKGARDALGTVCGQDWPHNLPSTVPTNDNMWLCAFGPHVVGLMEM